MREQGDNGDVCGLFERGDVASSLVYMCLAQRQLSLRMGLGYSDPTVFLITPREAHAAAPNRHHRDLLNGVTVDRPMHEPVLQGKAFSPFPQSTHELTN